MKRNIVIVDIDGTIAKVGDRLKYLKDKNPNWDLFYASCFDDEPIQEIIDLVDNLQQGYEIVFCTGRRESVREITEQWLSRNGLFGKVLMRPNGDKRHDVHVKPEQLKLSGIALEDISFVLEDRNSMVAKWRELGLKCLQVQEGDF
jgi:hypothetical protein